jgi:hypothetical protein
VGVLWQGDTEGRYLSRSEVVHAIALAHANAGSDEEHLIEDLLDPLNAAGDKVRAMHHRRCVQYVRRSWLRACGRVKRSPLIQNRVQALVQLGRVRAAINGAIWPGRAGATAYAIMQAHLAIAERAGGIEYHACVRDVADLAGVHLMTVVRHHKRLIRTGWIRRRGLRPRGLATRWRLCAR